MSLSAYKKKRRFDDTPEPEGKEKSSKTSLRFVIQKHDASHLHYDFRLEMSGVLKSWAVPKGPSLNPADKRLAMMVEDHPYDYRNFEGIIPAGNYGGGTVIVWDEGTYEPLEGEGLSRKEQENLLLKQLHTGNLKFIMHGKKIKGEYALFQMKGRGERSWILVKKKDAYAGDEDILKKDKSVKTGKSLAHVAKENGTELNHPEEKAKRPAKPKPVQLIGEPDIKKPKAPSKSASKKTAPSKKKALRKTAELLGDQLPLARRSAMPHDVVPMLATLINEAFDDAGWLYEIKWDGYRAVGYCEGKKVELVSRNLKSFTEKYIPVRDALKELNLKAVFDGEIVAVDDKGLAVFQSLQNWQNTPVHLQYFIFDILWLDGYDLTKIPLVERKRILADVLPESDDVIKYSDHVVEKGIEFFEAAVKQGLEGIMAKKAGSIYEIGERTEDWVKIKVSLRQEVVIVGYTEPRRTRKFFGSLLLGLYDGDELVYIGHTGSGFNAKSLEQIYGKLQPLVTSDCPFEKCPKGNMPVTWVKPKLVCEIKFTEWTKDRVARHPIFMGLRVDKKSKGRNLRKRNKHGDDKKIKQNKRSRCKKASSREKACEGLSCPGKKIRRKKNNGQHGKKKVPSGARSKARE